MTHSITSKPAELVPITVSEEGTTVYINNTRVTLDSVVEAFLEGATPEEIVYRYPSFDLADAYAVVGYYLRHRAEVQRYLEQRRDHAEQVRERNERRFPPEGVRERLLARRQEDM